MVNKWYRLPCSVFDREFAMHQNLEAGSKPARMEKTVEADSGLPPFCDQRE
jgi:hypothetical protein